MHHGLSAAVLSAEAVTAVLWVAAATAVLLAATVLLTASHGVCICSLVCSCHSCAP